MKQMEKFNKWNLRIISKIDFILKKKFEFQILFLEYENLFFEYQTFSLKIKE